MTVQPPGAGRKKVKKAAVPKKTEAKAVEAGDAAVEKKEKEPSAPQAVPKAVPKRSEVKDVKKPAQKKQSALQRMFRRKSGAE